MKRIFLLRHGATSLSGKYVGVSDVGLSEDGKKDILCQLPYAAGHEFQVIFCSPLRRCRETLEILGLQQKGCLDSRIAEIDFGRWEGKTFSEIADSRPDLVNDWSRGGASFRFPGGEKMSDFYKRIDDFASSIQALEEEEILIVSHGGVIRHLICHFLHLSYDSYLYFRVQCGKFTTIELHSEGGILTGLNSGIADV